MSDQLLTAAALIVITFASMRLLYGAWPWETNKTWYRARHAVEYVALQRACRERPTRQQLGVDVTSNHNFAESIGKTERQADDPFEDSFDRSLIVSDDMVPLEVASGSPEQLTLRESGYGGQT